MEIRFRLAWRYDKWGWSFSLGSINYASDPDLGWCLGIAVLFLAVSILSKEPA